MRVIARDLSQQPIAAHYRAANLRQNHAELHGRFLRAERRKNAASRLRHASSSTWSNCRRGKQCAGEGFDRQCVRTRCDHRLAKLDELQILEPASPIVDRYQLRVELARF
jgi:hypothetical protein